MSEVLICPSCHRKLQVPQNLLGEEVQCPTCHTTFTARAVDEPAGAPPESPAPIPVPEPARPRRKDAGDADPESGRVRRRRPSDYEPHRGALVLVLGILSVALTLTGACFPVGFVLGIVSWVMGNRDTRAIAAGRMDPEGEGITQGGRICGIVGTALSTLIFLAVLAYILCIFVIVGIANTGQRRNW
jgi:hypothetical protein